MSKVLSSFVLSCLMLIFAASPASAADEIIIEGGGWGHGIGMSQHGAQAMAEDGKTAEQITAHFYTGSSLGTVGTGGLVGHADPLRIGIAQDQSAIGFESVNGALTVCLGECFPAEEAAWSVVADGSGQCQLYKDGAPLGGLTLCEGSVEWQDQPAVRVTIPSLNRTYARGRMLFEQAPDGKFHVLVEVGLEEYLYGLGEMPSSWEAEALKAQAIAGRTYALYKAWIYRHLEQNDERMASCGCHLYASTVDQKYIGWAKEAEGTDGYWGAKWRAAVDATTGMAIIHDVSNGRAIEAYYFSSTGGATENNEDVWGGSPYSYLRSVADPGATTWQKVMSKIDIAQLLGFEEAFDARITGRFDSGSPSEIQVRGTVGGVLTTKTFTGNQLRWKLGLRSHFIKTFSGFLPPSFSRFLKGDFDGNGVDEVAAFSTDDGTWWVFAVVDGELVGSQWADFSTTTGWDFQVAGDFDGDGKTDIANFNSANGTWWVSESTGSGFSTSLWADFSTPSGWVARSVADFDGDGRDDIAQFHPSNGTWWVSESTGSGFSTSLWADFSTPSGWVAQQAGDFDGDGRYDIANFHPSNGTWWISRSTGTGFVTQLWADFSTPNGWGPQLVGDFNGDGREDLANYHSSNGTWWISKSLGKSFATSLWADYSTAKGWAPQLVGDFDGDGRDDIANFYSGNGTWWVSRSDGKSFSTYLRATLSPVDGWDEHVVADIDGDGEDELVNWLGSTQTWLIR